MRFLAPTNELERLLWVARSKYAYFITRTQLRQYLSKRKIRYKDYNANKAQKVGKKIPVGTEYIKSDGMTLIKVSENKWEYKQRYLYKKYHNVELTSEDYIIFLDQDRNNFDINNLKKISRHESSILSSQKIFSKNPNVTQLGIDNARLIIKAKKAGEKIENNGIKH